MNQIRTPILQVSDADIAIKLMQKLISAVTCYKRAPYAKLKDEYALQARVQMNLLAQYAKKSTDETMAWAARESKLIVSQNIRTA